jgi:hypothetical protein
MVLAPAATIVMMSAMTSRSGFGSCEVIALVLLLGALLIGRVGIGRAFLLLLLITLLAVR